MQELQKFLFRRERKRKEKKKEKKDKNVKQNGFTGQALASLLTPAARWVQAEAV